MSPVDPAELVLPATSALLGFSPHLCVRACARERVPTLPACHKQPCARASPCECGRESARAS